MLLFIDAVLLTVKLVVVSPAVQLAGEFNTTKVPLLPLPNDTLPYTISGQSACKNNPVLATRPVMPGPRMPAILS
jgi:hypothetical protein